MPVRFRHLLYATAVPSATIVGANVYLRSKFPLIACPDELDPGKRKDVPKIGLKAHSGEAWRPYHFAHAFYADVPRAWLEGKGRRVEGPDEGTDESALAWARAYWDTWPIKLEKFVFRNVKSVGDAVKRPGVAPMSAAQDLDFVPGASPLDQHIIVEAHDKVEPGSAATTDGPRPQLESGPIIASVLIAPSPDLPLPPSQSVTPTLAPVGVYQSFAVQSSPKGPSYARLVVAEHFSMDDPNYPTQGHGAPTGDEAAKSAPVPGKIMNVLHMFLMRLMLVDAVRILKHDKVRVTLKQETAETLPVATAVATNA